MRFRSALPLLVLLTGVSAAHAAILLDCNQGQGESVRALWDGYAVQSGPWTGHDGQCRAALVAPDGTTVYEVTGTNAGMNGATGNDINNDGSRDVLLESSSGSSHTYAIVTPGATPALQRQFVTSVELSFGDRDGDGKTEIWARDFAFGGFDHIPKDLSPYPLVVFRLRGGTLYNVSPAFWTDYEADIQQAKSEMSKKDLDDFAGTNANTDQGSGLSAGAGGGGGGGRDKGMDPDEQRRHDQTEGLVLQIILDYLYGGRGAQGWDYISDNWPQLDRARVRQDILKARAAGVLAEINRQAPAAKPQ